ncbi:MAG: phosphoesterase [Sulfobacillus acidophilus]|uniref:Phosphoesterase n=1 Tax=Sulfobacillus acidophilus TaxID=53633 RepID=A0A2T2WIM6_9FIRM|nr:MAG: phosphoesterase [Sulfobacillus acidophilus]
MTTKFPIPAFDRHWELVINGWTRFSPLLDQLGVVVAKYSPEIWAVVFLLLWFWPPRRQNRARRAVVYAVVAGVLAVVINMILGHVLPYRPRPFVFEPHVIHALIKHRADTSFPSTHAAGSFAFAIGLFYAGVADGAWGLLFAAAVSISRAFAGVHWPTDVLAGAVLGILSGLAVLAGRNALEWLVARLFRIFRVEPEHRYRRSHW